MTGHLQHELIGRFYQAYFLPSAKNPEAGPPKAISAFLRSLQEGRPAQARVPLRHKEGHLLPMLLHTTAIRDPRGSIVAICGSFEVQRFRAQDLRSRRHAVPQHCLDSVTGVATQSFTQFRLRENLAALGEYQMPFGIICARPEGLDRFTAAYGREARDAALGVIAEDLSNCFRPGDLVGHWGDEEFIVILANCPTPSLERVLQRIRETVSSVEIRWWGEILSLPVGFGWTSADPGDSVETLVQRAWRSAARGADTQAAGAIGGDPLPGGVFRKD